MEKQESIARVAALKSLYPRLYHLAMAIQEFEGYAPGTKSHANRNPGNLRYSPYQYAQIGGFAQFTSYFDGLFALLWDLWSKCDGRSSSGLGPHSTLAALVEVYAPAADENDPAGYVGFLVGRLSTPMDTKLSWFLEG